VVDFELLYRSFVSKVDDPKSLEIGEKWAINSK
jgi:hypothetical protein